MPLCDRAAEPVSGVSIGDTPQKVLTRSGDDNRAAGPDDDDRVGQHVGGGRRPLGRGPAEHPRGELDLPGPGADPDPPRLSLEDVAGPNRCLEGHRRVPGDQPLVPVGTDAQLGRDVPSIPST